jgi:hypothetical protein
MSQFSNFAFNPKPQTIQVSWSKLAETTLDLSVASSMVNNAIYDIQDILGGRDIEAQAEKDFERVNSDYFGE